MNKIAKVSTGVRKIPEVTGNARITNALESLERGIDMLYSTLDLLENKISPCLRAPEVNQATNPVPQDEYLSKLAEVIIVRTDLIIRLRGKVEDMIDRCEL